MSVLDDSFNLFYILWRTPIFERKKKFKDNFHYQKIIWNYYDLEKKEEVEKYNKDFIDNEIKNKRKLVEYEDGFLYDNYLCEDIKILFLDIVLNYDLKNKKYYLKIKYKNCLTFNYYFYSKINFDEIECYYVSKYTYTNLIDKNFTSKNIREIITNESALKTIKEKISIFYDPINFQNSKPENKFYLKFLEWILINQLLLPQEMASHILFFI